MSGTHQSDEEDFVTDIKRDVDDNIIKVHERGMPLRLIDTYTGLILERSEITSLLKTRREFGEKLDDVIRGAKPPIEPPSKRFANRSRLVAFIAEYLAFAMFSHRWGDREIDIADVRDAGRGIYSIVRPPDDLSEEQARNFLAGANKLQEFCCVAAKCGFRWAWADTCCINERVYGEKSESLNSMFLWYHNSDLTVVYLGDVEDVERGRFPTVDSEGGHLWFDDPEIGSPFHPSYPYKSDSTITLRDCGLQLQSMWPDTQVEAADLEAHLIRKFPDTPLWKVRRIYRKLPAWTTRGWTLQEMLASKRLRFYSKDWTLLEEADDRDTDDEEKTISISSFKYRARLVDHRESAIWCNALANTTGVFAQDLTKFEPGAKDVRKRLQWAARRRTLKVEDMAYCLLGIFDITLPVYYGEGHRAFFRLQEELMKRTGDTSLFDWCGRSSSVNSFLAHEPECFVEHPLSFPDIPDSTESTFHMIINIFSTIFGTMWTGFKAAVSEIMASIRNVMKAAAPGHSLINGELSISLFEHKVKRCERVESCTPEDTHHYYNLEVEGLEHTKVSLPWHTSSLTDRPSQYRLCRVWNRHTHNVFQILVEFIEYILKDTFNEILNKLTGNDAPEAEPCSRTWRLSHDLDWTLICIAKLKLPSMRMRTIRNRSCEKRCR